MKSSTAVLRNDSDAHGLVLGCKHGINQCAELLKQLSETSFTNVEGESSSIGAHMRHILDRYQCFFAGLQSGCVDYDERKRDKSIESCLEAAGFALASVARRIDEIGGNGSASLQVSESVHHLSPKVNIESSINRELMGLITHTTHHLAIIGLIARNQGYQLDHDFGKAPSTIVFERS